MKALLYFGQNSVIISSENGSNLKCKIDCWFFKMLRSHCLISITRHCLL